MSQDLEQRARETAREIQRRAKDEEDLLSDEELQRLILHALQQVREEGEAEVRKLSEELNWQNHRNAGHPTKGGFEFYINEEWTGLAHAAIDQDLGWHAALRKCRTDPDDERVRVRRVAEDDTIIAEHRSLTARVRELEERIAESQHQNELQIQYTGRVADKLAEVSAALAAAREAVRFYALGGPWTEHCQKALDAALAARAHGGER